MHPPLISSLAERFLGGLKGIHPEVADVVDSAQKLAHAVKESPEAALHRVANGAIDTFTNHAPKPLVRAVSCVGLTGLCVAFWAVQAYTTATDGKTDGSRR